MASLDILNPLTAINSLNGTNHLDFNDKQLIAQNGKQWPDESLERVINYFNTLPNILLYLPQVDQHNLHCFYRDLLQIRKLPHERYPENAQKVETILFRFLQSQQINSLTSRQIEKRINQRLFSWKPMSQTLSRLDETKRKEFLGNLYLFTFELPDDEIVRLVEYLNRFNLETFNPKALHHAARHITGSHDGHKRADLLILFLLIPNLKNSNAIDFFEAPNNLYLFLKW